MTMQPTTPGVRFCPSDKVLFCHYLYGKIKGTLFSPLELSTIKDYDLYGKDEPWTVWDKCGGNNSTAKDDLFFFTILKKKNGCDSKRIDRTVGVDRRGTWSGEDKGNLSKYRFVNPITGCCISTQGFKKRFRYENPTVPEQNGRWIMHEYSLPDECSNCVLCRLRKNIRANNHMETNKRGRDECGFEDDKIEAAATKKRKNDLEIGINLQENRQDSSFITSSPSAEPMEKAMFVDDGWDLTFDADQLLYILQSNDFDTAEPLI